METRDSHSGFSLIELLVVIAIIAILAALLLPALAGSKIKGLQVACLSNVKQLTLAGTMYMSDTGQGFPENNPGYASYDPNAPAIWYDAIANYNITSNSRACPSVINMPIASAGQPIAGAANLSWACWPVPDDTSVSSSYGVNAFLDDMITSYAYLPATKQAVVFQKPSGIQKPAQTPVFFDENCMDTTPMESDFAASDLYWGTASPWGLGGGRGMGCCTILRHGGPTAGSSVPYIHGRPIPGAINMGFDDGHGELAKLQNLWTYTWHLNWNPAKVKGP